MNGIVFYVYSGNQCKNVPSYMDEVEKNAQVIHSLNKDISLALVTNCDIPISTARYLSVIIPIHENDVFNMTSKQWQTRLLYNAYLPFNYSFIIDSHVFPCDSLALSDLFTEFAESNIDIAFGNRMNIPDRVLGACILSRWGSGSFDFWKRSFLYMREKGLNDDQEAIRVVKESEWKEQYRWRWLSSNWVFASHGVDSNGVFYGPGRCYRSSVIVTGPVRWIHGHPNECVLMNGRHYEYSTRARVYYQQGSCDGIMEGTTVLFSEQELQNAVKPYSAPTLEWDKSGIKNKLSLYW